MSIVLCHSLLAMQELIKPTEITNFSRTKSELESFFLFGVFCAGKNSDYASKCLARLLNGKQGDSPFAILKSLGETGIHNALVASRIGQYSRLTKAIMGAVELDLKTCTLEDLMSVHGVGQKTARFFLLHSRPDCRCAVLDTHILRWLRDNGFDAPQSTPTSVKQYKDLEEKFLFLANLNFPNMSIAQIDLTLWMKYSGRLEDDSFPTETLVD
jgi:thermostable 8-oxoguanine DNA glycosylase